MKIDSNYNVAKWYVDAALAVHLDFKLHTGGCLTLSEEVGAIVSMSQRQKLNTRSSTEAELMGVDDAVGKFSGYKNF